MIRDWVVLKPWALLTIGIAGTFLLGSFAIDALLPGGMRDAMFLTLPSHTGAFMTDYALTIYQAGVLAGGVILGVRLALQHTER